MSKLVRLNKLMMMVLLLGNLSVTPAQTIPARGRTQLISAYEDDPYVRAVDVRRMDAARFSMDQDGRPMLNGDVVTYTEASKIYRRDTQTNQFKPFAWNPWPVWVTANEQGDFRFPNEERFPLFKPERGTDGKILLKDGLQLWTPLEQRLGNTTAFEAAHAVKSMADRWAGRDIRWGVNGLLDIEPHAFIDFNAFYSPSTRSLFFGVVPYRLPDETAVKMFETATSWELVAHECGHAVHDALKPNIIHGETGYGTWTESLADQTAMWASLHNRERVARLLADTHGELNQSNALTRNTEAFVMLTGKGTGIRDAFHELKVSDTTEEVHDRSEVLTGAAYKIFLSIYDELKKQCGETEALRQAGDIMGFFLMRTADYMPENLLTLEDVAKAYLKVDKEYFDSRYHQRLVEEFTRREIFDADSVREWREHEAAMPQLFLHPQWPDEKIEHVLNANLHWLGIGPDFGLKVQSITRLVNGNESRGPIRWRGAAPAIVRVQLTQGRGEEAKLLDNHGILVFRVSGMLADYHPPIPQEEAASFAPDAFVQTQALTMLKQASQIRLEEHGAPLALVRQPNGQWTVEARVLRGDGLNTYLEVFSPAHPQGERREVLLSPVPPHKQIHLADDFLK